MFGTLPESRRVRELSACAGGLSAVFHGLLIALLVAATAGASDRLSRTRVGERLHLAPLPPLRPASLRETERATPKPPLRPRTSLAAVMRLPAIAPIDFTLPDIPSVMPDIDLSERLTTEADFAGASDAAAIWAAMTDGQLGTGNGGPYEPGQVTRMVAPVSGNPEPKYPEALRRMRIEGDVIAEFVIDTVGVAEPATVRIVRSAHGLFTRAVQDVLPRLRFFPAELNGYRVAVRVRQPFRFVLLP